jgi:hypothetical protein
MSSVLRDGLHVVPGRARPVVVAFDRGGTWEVAETVLPALP